MKEQAASSSGSTGILIFTAVAQVLPLSSSDKKVDGVIPGTQQSTRQSIPVQDTDPKFINTVHECRLVKSFE